MDFMSGFRKFKRRGCGLKEVRGRLIGLLELLELCSTGLEPQHFVVSFQEKMMLQVRNKLPKLNLRPATNIMANPKKRERVSCMNV